MTTLDQSLGPSTDRPLRRWVIALLTAALAMAARGALEPWLGSSLPFVFALPAMLVVGWFAGNAAAAVAALACAAWLLMPALAPTLSPADGWRPIFYFLPSALLLGFLGSRLRHGSGDHEPLPRDGERTAMAWLWAAMLLGAAVPLAMLVAGALSLYDRALADAHVRVERAARISEEHALKVLETNITVINQALDIVGDEPEAALLQREAALHRQLKRMAASLPQLQGVFIIGASGQMIATNRALPAPHQIDFSDRAYFAHHRAGGPQPYFSEVLTSRTTGEPFFDMSVRRTLADGRFGGTVSTSLSPAYFAKFYRDVSDGTAAVGIALRRADGLLLASWPPTPSLSDAKVSVGSLGASGARGASAASITSGASAAALMTDADLQATAAARRTSLVATRQLGNYPVFVTAQMDSQMALAPWYDQMLLLLAVTFPTVAGLVYIGWLALQRTRRALEVATALREETEQRTKAEESLRQSQKMQAVGQLTGGIAHDFNNLLQIIAANLHLIGKDVGANPGVAKRLAHAAEAVKRGANVASQLLAFGRRQPLAPKVIHAGKLVLGMEDLLRRALGEAMKVEVIVSGGLWNTKVDPSQLENAVLNLALNARDAMDGVGQLTIEVSNASLDQAYAEQHQDLQPGQYVMLSVSDTGVGMTAEVAAQAFLPFFTTKPPGAGTGLGLSMVYGFVKQSGGHARIYSEPGHGSNVKLYLPRSRGSEDANPVPTATASTGGSETILVVEDDAAVRDTAVEMLRALGYRVAEAADADSAMALIDGGLAVELLFTDVVMPGKLRSPELARRGRQRLPRLAVLYTSGYTQDAIVHGGQLDEGVALLPKPYTAELLAQRVRAELDKPQRQPIEFPPEIASVQPLFDATPTTLRRATVLFVEDDELIRSSTAEMMRELGYEVLEASSAEEAITLIFKADFAVLVADIGLPGMSGDVFAAQVRGIRPNIRIIFATGASTIHDDPRDQTGPVVLRKPYDSAAIDAALRKALARG